ncbi:MAG: DNA polymerase, partial [Kiritimatiellia bacterium]
YSKIPEKYLQYAALDAVATYLSGGKIIKLCRDVTELYPLHALGINGTHGIMALKDWGLLSHNIQLRGDIALHWIERFGINVDQAQVKILDKELNAEIEAANAIMARYGFVPGKKGNQGEYNRIITEAEKRHGVTVPTTAKVCNKSQAADDLIPLADDEFVAAFLKYKENNKLRSTFIKRLQEGGNRIYPHYNLLTNTGRTSCSGPNVQQLPRENHIRECIVPAPGHIFLACDYSGIELCTLAQLTWSRFGQSRMRELINQGVDLHRFTASQILKKNEVEVTSEERRKAKAANFGVGGGMGAKGLVAYAWTTFGVKMTVLEGEQWREHWLNLFPEMRLYLEDEDNLVKLINVYDLSDFPSADAHEEIAAMVLMRIAGGAQKTSAGRLFAKNEIDWAWSKIVESPATSVKRLQAAIEKRTGSRELQQAIIPGQVAVTPSGRIRADCRYCESRNTPFQGMASDGAKLALYDLARARFRVVAFIHDEVLVEVPECGDYRPAAEAISGIMISAMKRVCPDVTIRTEYAVMRRWCKDAKATYDSAGHLVPYEDGDTGIAKPPIKALGVDTNAA